ncbi:hypothetical protein HYW17_00810 [Candidatus Uhrbacteria bacterium]|nr:hypothetical protein [Candidatus Uhrbacteria bacterium]
MKNTKNWVARRSFAAILAVFACGGRRVEAAESSGFYRLETALLEYGAVGHPQVVRVWVVPVGAWKINTKFPTELKVEAPADVQVQKTVQRAGDAAVLRDDRAEFHITATPKKAGKYALTLEMKFGLCRKSECIWRTERIAVKLQAR